MTQPQTDGSVHTAVRQLGSNRTFTGFVFPLTARQHLHSDGLWGRIISRICCIELVSCRADINNPFVIFKIHTNGDVTATSQSSWSIFKLSSESTKHQTSVNMKISPGPHLLCYQLLDHAVPPQVYIRFFSYYSQFWDVYMKPQR